jgi:hypothetical protein
MSVRFARTLLVGLACLTAWPTAAKESKTREWYFDVTLDGRPIGEHRYVLRESADRRELTSEARFRVRVLFFDAYRYDHRAQEWWRGDCLEKIAARTDTNGEESLVDAGPFDGCVQTFAYWNPAIVDARRLLNPQTGEQVPVEVRALGNEVLAGQAVTRFRLVGGGRTPLQIDLWYTPAGEWMALESLTPEGRRLRYERRD